MKSLLNPNVIARLSSTTTKKAGGQALIVFALTVFALLAFVGLALDGGAALAKRRAMQNAADAASLAGARELIGGSDQPTIYDRIAEYSDQRNGAASFSASYYPGSEALGAGSDPVPSGATGVCVTSRIRYPTVFLSLMGISSVSVSAQSCAVAHSTCPGGQYVIWAQASHNSGHCNQVIDWSSDNYMVTGDVHSNGNVDISGSGDTVVGNTEYLTSCNYCTSASNNVSPTLGTADDWPVWYDISDYEPPLTPSPQYPTGRPAGPKAQQAINNGQYSEKPGGYNFTATDADGLYWVDGDATFSLNNISKTITIVSPSGAIVVSGSSLNLSPYTDDGLLLFSDDQPPTGQMCSNPLVSVSGSNSNLSGIIFTPGGLTQLSGSDDSTFSGSVIGWSVKLTGDGLNMAYNDQYCPTTGRIISAALQRP